MGCRLPLIQQILVWLRQGLRDGLPLADWRPTHHCAASAPGAARAPGAACVLSGMTVMPIGLGTFRITALKLYIVCKVYIVVVVWARLVTEAK